MTETYYTPERVARNPSSMNPIVESGTALKSIGYSLVVLLTVAKWKSTRAV